MAKNNNKEAKPHLLGSFFGFLKRTATKAKDFLSKNMTKGVDIVKENCTKLYKKTKERIHKSIVDTVTPLVGDYASILDDEKAKDIIVEKAKIALQGKKPQISNDEGKQIGSAISNKALNYVKNLFTKNISTLLGYVKNFAKSLTNMFQNFIPTLLVGVLNLVNNLFSAIFDINQENDASPVIQNKKEASTQEIDLKLNNKSPTMTHYRDHISNTEHTSNNNQPKTSALSSNRISLS